MNPCKVLDYYGTCHKDFGRLIFCKIRSVAINNAKKGMREASILESHTKQN